MANVDHGCRPWQPWMVNRNGWQWMQTVAVADGEQEWMAVDADRGSRGW